MKSEVFSLPPDCPPDDRRREHEDRCEVVCDFDSDRDEQDCGVHCSVAPCQTIIQARGKGKELLSLSDEGPDADAEHCQSEGAESEAEEQAVHCGVTLRWSGCSRPCQTIIQVDGKGKELLSLFIPLHLVHCARQLPDEGELRPVEDGLELVGGQALDVGRPLVQGEAGVVDELFDGRPHHRPRP